MSGDYSESYAQVLEETLFLRRYTGTGSSRPRHDAQCRGRATPYKFTELVGSIQQGDHQVIVLAADVARNGLTLPVTTNDKVVVAGKELSIIAALARKAPDGSLIAYELQARG